MAFSPDSEAFVYGISAPGREAAPQRITVWDLNRGRARAAPDLATTESGAAVVSLALAPGGHTLLTTRTPAVGELSNEVWDTDSQRRKRTFRDSELASVHTEARADGRLVVGDNRIVRVPSGKLTERDLVQGEQISALAFSPDGRTLAAADPTGRVALWDGDVRHRAGVLRNVFPAPLGKTPEAVGALAFSPDGHTLAVGGDAGTIQLWDTETQQPLGGPLPTPGEGIETLAFSADNATLYAGGVHTPLQRYTVGAAQAVTQVCARAKGTNLTRAQWRAYVPGAEYRRVCG